MLQDDVQNKGYRLYDENMVHNIMLATGLSVMEYVRENMHADSDEICDFIEANTADIIDDTVQHLKSMDDLNEGEWETDDGGDDGGDADSGWLPGEKE